MDICIEIHPIGKSCGIGCEPAAEFREVIAATKVDKTGCLIGAFRGKPPGIDGGTDDFFFTECAVTVKSGLFVQTGEKESLFQGQKCSDVTL